jgi:DNA-directed RNA polymerase beta subunit
MDLPTKTRINYSKLDKYGLPIKGTFLKPEDPVIGKYAKCKDEKGNEYYKDMTTKVKIGNEGSIIDKVYTCQTNEDGDRMVKVRTCYHRPPVMGDKFASRNGQKGTFGIVLKKEDLPYTEDGIVPDIILDPAGYPSRMTVNQLYEILFGNMAADLGIFGSYNAF